MQSTRSTIPVPMKKGEVVQALREVSKTLTEDKICNHVSIKRKDGRYAFLIMTVADDIYRLYAGLHSNWHPVVPTEASLLESTSCAREEADRLFENLIVAYGSVGGEVVSRPKKMYFLW